MAEVIEVEPEIVEPVAAEEAPAIEPPEYPEDEVTITIGEETPLTVEEPAPQWVKDVRKQNRELQREIRELKAKEQGQAPKVELGPKPTLEALEYDADRYEKELESWHDRKRAVEAKEAAKREAEETQQRAWQAKLDAYGEKKTALRVSDYDEAEESVQQVLSSTQQGILIDVTEDPAKLVYALAQNPERLKQLSLITNPAKFSYEIGKLEPQLKTTPRKAPPPETTVKGTAKLSGSVDSTLAKLREEAYATGDMSKVVAYRAKKRA